jgi:hypothetical protein
MKKIFALLFVTASILSCGNDDQEGVKKTPGSLELNFIHTVGNIGSNGNGGTDILQLGNTYQNSSAESYTVTELKYIISNITLKRKDGSEFIYPIADSYFLINEAQQDSKKIILNNIDPDEYTNITFGFGVDPTKYPIESGTLNFVPTAEEADMLWSWSAGYKFIKFEGTYTSATVTTETPFLIHVGSHGATLDNYKEIELSLISDTGMNTIIEGDVNAVESIFFDLGQVFDGPNTIRIEDKTDIQVDPVNAPKIANNIQTAFYIPQG